MCCLAHALTTRTNIYTAYVNVCEHHKYNARDIMLYTSTLEMEGYSFCVSREILESTKREGHVGKAQNNTNTIIRTHVTNIGMSLEK